MNSVKGIILPPHAFVDTRLPWIRDQVLHDSTPLCPEPESQNICGCQENTHPHTHTHSAKWQSVFVSPTNKLKIRLCVFVLVHLADVIALSCWSREGRPFWTLVGRFGERGGGWSLWLVFPCLESMTGSVYARTLTPQFMKHTHRFTWSAATVCRPFYSVRLVAMASCEGKKQTLKADSVWQLRVSFHRALWCCVVLWLVCVTNQIVVASLLLPAQRARLPVQQSGPEFTASREKQTPLSLKSSWKTPSIRFWSPASSLGLNVTKNKTWT